MNDRLVSTKIKTAIGSTFDFRYFINPTKAEELGKIQLPVTSFTGALL